MTCFINLVSNEFLPLESIVQDSQFVSLFSIYSKGYREKSHYCLIVAMKALFVADKLLDVTLVEAFAMAKVLRENADYDSEYSKESAENLVEKAKKFLAVGRKILGTQ